MRERYCCLLPSTKKELYALMDSPLAFASSEKLSNCDYGREKNLCGARPGIKQLPVFLGYDLPHHTPLSQKPKPS